MRGRESESRDLEAWAGDTIPGRRDARGEIATLRSAFADFDQPKPPDDQRLASFERSEPRGFEDSLAPQDQHALAHVALLADTLGTRPPLARQVVAHHVHRVHWRHYDFAVGRGRFEPKRAPLAPLRILRLDEVAAHMIERQCDDEHRQRKAEPGVVDRGEPHTCQY